MKNQVDSPKKKEDSRDVTVPTDRKARLSEFEKLEVHIKISQILFDNKIIETENLRAIADLIMQGLNKACRSNTADFTDFIAPIRDLVQEPNPYALYLTQYVLEVIINDPHVIDVYGTDLEIYTLTDGIINQINAGFEGTEGDSPEKRYEPPDLHSPRFLPLLKELAANIVSNPIGNYYYSCLLGENFNQEDILYEEKDRWYWKGKLMDISALLEEFRTIHGKDVANKQKIFLRRLRNIDNRAGVPTGHRILEILAEYIPRHDVYVMNKQYYMKKVTKAKGIMKKMENAKKSFLKKLQERIQPDDMKKLTAHIDEVIGRSKAAIMISQVVLFYGAEWLPGIPHGSEKDGRIPKKFSKEKAIITTLSQELRNLLGSDKHTSFFLKQFDIEISTDSIRKKIISKSK